MKNSMKLYINAAGLGLLLFALSCKKGGSNPTPVNNPPTQTKSQWTIDGTTYTGDETSFTISSFNYFESSSSAPTDSQVEMRFGSTPTASKTYNVISYVTFISNHALSGNQCTIDFTRTSDSKTFYSTGAAGNTVSVTVNSSGKITATFSKVSMTTDGTTTIPISGGLVQP